jgi:hypothetical protein
VNSGPRCDLIGDELAGDPQRISGRQHALLSNRAYLFGKVNEQVSRRLQDHLIAFMQPAMSESARGAQGSRHQRRATAKRRLAKPFRRWNIRSI